MILPKQKTHSHRPRKIYHSIVKNVKTGEEFYTWFSKARFKKANDDDTIHVTSATTNDEYTWYTNKKFLKKFLEFVETYKHIVCALNHKSFIDIEFHVVTLRNNKPCGRRYFYKGDKEFDNVEEYSKSKLKKGDTIKIYKNETLIKTI